MSRRGGVNKDPSEGIRQVLGRHTKILLKTPVKLEKGGDKTDNRIIVLTPHRLYIMTNKVPTKIDHHFHFLDISAIESKRLNQVVFKVNDKSYAFRPAVEVGTSEVLDQIIITLATAIRNIFPGVLLSHVIPRVEVVPVKRIQSILEMKPLDFKDMGPCGGFSSQYACYCDYYNMPYREEVAWDVDTIYFSHDSHEMSLTDFEHLEQRDLICIISALEHNTWFSKLSASANSSKMANEVIDKILSVVSKSISLQEIYLSSAGLRWDFFQRLASSMTSNQYCNLTTIDISLNFVEDKGLSPLSSAISHFPRGLRHLNLSHCTLSGKAANNLAQSLITNKLSLNSLTYLNLSGNSLREDVQVLTNFLAQPNVISILDLSSTEVPSELLFSALVRGCTANLSHLNLARNPFTARKSKGDVPASFKQFFATTLCLKYLNMSHGRLPVDALKHLLLGLACNEMIKDVELNISSNNLGAGGAVVMENALPGVNCVSRLDVSENNLDVELANVVNGVARSRSVLSLNISKNLPKIKARDVIHVMDAIVQLIQDEETSLQKLNLSDCRLKTDLNNVINALGSNQCIQILDISGNGMGDVGARLLAKALQINTRLRTIHLDRNNISLQGYQDITYALQSNFSMRHIPFPTYDLQAPMKANPDRVDGMMRRMQDYLQRNSSPRSYASRGKNFRLTQGFLLSSTQMVLDRWSAQVQDTIHSARLEQSETTEEIERAEGYIKDAEQCKLLISSLHDAAASRDLAQCPVQKKLSDLAADLEQFLSEHIEACVGSMLNTASERCPTVLSPSSRSMQDLRSLAGAKSKIPPDYVKNLVYDTLGYEVTSKVNEMNLILANHISDKVIDDVVDGLARSYKSIVGDLGSYKKKRSLTPDVLKSSSIKSESDVENLSQGGDSVSQHSTPSPLSTPQIAKRKSIHDRKLRPKSFVDGDHATPDLLPNMKESVEEEEDRVTELPEIPQLQHLAKNRPRRPKRHASSGSVGQVSLGDGEGTDMKEGLENFFAKKSLSPKVTPVGSPLLEDGITGSRHGSISSNSSFSRSREDIRDTKQALKVTSSGKVSPLTLDSGGRRSPAEPEDKPKAGLSCLITSTVDEDSEPLAPAKSPEKKSIISPSGRSISDIFGKVAQEKVSKNRNADRSGGAVPDRMGLGSAGPSPFTGRRSETEIFSSRRRSFLPGEPDRSEEKSPEDGDQDDVVRRARGHGLGGDILKEMRVRQELKRASVIPKTEGSQDKSELPDEERPFGNIHLRATGMSTSISSPSSQLSPDLQKSFIEQPKSSETESIKHSSSSIIGLRAAAFDTGSKLKSEDSSCDDVNGPKPRPPPKPRPWSIVGVDRKSGEFTQVEATSTTADTASGPSTSTVEKDEEKRGNNLLGQSTARGSVRDMIANLNKPESPGASTVLPTTSVRDRIANMNKSNETDISKRKGNSLPRNTDPVSKSPGTRQKNSPINRKKDSTSDDPRILKLEDDFLYDDTVNV